MPMPQSQINQQLSSRLNSLESKVDETNGYLKGVVESNERLRQRENSTLTNEVTVTLKAGGSL